MISSGRPFSLSGWRIEPLRNRILRDGEAVHLEPKAMDVLVVLAEQAPQVVSREALLRRVWGEVAVTDDVLTNAVWQLRRACGDSAQGRRLIETVRGRGYRLTVAAEAVPREAASPPSRTTATTRSRAARWLPAAALGGALVALGATLAGVLGLGPSTDPPDPEASWRQTGQASAPTPRAAIEEARAALVRGERSAAEAILRGVLRDHPDFTAARERLAWLLLLSGRGEEAQRALQEAIDRAPEDPRLLASKARLRFFLGDPAGAVESARRSLELDPGSRPARRWLAVALAADGQRGAAADLLRVLTPDPSWVGDAGHAWASLGDADAARAQLSSPAGRRASGTQQALVYTALGRPLLALSALEAAVDREEAERFQIPVDPRFGPLRGAARFEALVSRLAAPRGP